MFFSQQSKVVISVFLFSLISCTAHNQQLPNLQEGIAQNEIRTENNPSQFKTGMKYLNYAGAVASVSFIIYSNQHRNNAWDQIFARTVMLGAGAAVNGLSATVDPEKHKKRNIALIVANLLGGFGNAVLAKACITDPITTTFFIGKGIINAMNMLYRATVIAKKK